MIRPIETGGTAVFTAAGVLPFTAIVGTMLTVPLVSRKLARMKENIFRST